MREFRVYLTGQDSTNRSGPPLHEILLSERDRERIVRQYRDYLPAREWLPTPPVHVFLTGQRGKTLPRSVSLLSAFELQFLKPESNGRPSLKKMVAAAAAVAAGIMPAAASPAPTPAVPTPHPPCAQERRSSGPPTAPLSSSTRLTTNMLPLMDEFGQPVELGAFHSNVYTLHTNVPAYHHNLATPHVNSWSNHSNVPEYYTPHTNVVPGDYIF